MMSPWQPFRFGGDTTEPGNGSEDPRSAARKPPSQCVAAQTADSWQVETWLPQSQPWQRGS